MTLLSPAKINLRLKIEGRRDDGFHLLSMLNIFCNLTDEIDIKLDETPGIKLQIVPEGILPDIEKNLAYQAARKFLDTFQINQGLTIKIKKHIPLGSGLGGGSSNAATVLKFLLNEFEPALRTKNQLKPQDIEREVRKIAAEIGSDVMFFFSSGAAKISGIGEIVEEINIPFLDKLSFFLIMPEESISTSEIYEALRKLPINFKEDLTLKRYSADFEGSIKEQYQSLLAIIDNDLQKLGAWRSKLVNEVIDRMKLLEDYVTCMSGSGSAFFVFSRKGVKVSQQDAETIKIQLQNLPLKIRETCFLGHEKPTFAS